MKNEQNAPKIRLKGFTDAWELRKLHDLFTERNEQYPTSNDYPLMAFIANVGVASKGERYDRSALVKDEEGKKYKRTEKGDFIYSSNNLETGSIGLNNYGNACISPVYSVFKSKHNADADFLGRILLRKEFIHQMVQYRQGVVYGQWRIHESDFLNLGICVPPLAEQRQIGAYFRTLDHLITLHQRKCETLQKLKKSMLQKMFPKNGSYFPEIRFAGFTDAWELREFDKIFFEYSEKNHEELPPLTIIQGKGTILRDESDRNLIYDKSGLKNYKLVNKNDFILHLRSFEGGLEMANSCGIVSPAYHIFHGEKIDPRFYYPFFRSKYFIAVLLKPHVYGIRDGKSIDVEGMKSITIPYPSLEEQTRIGQYFEQLDHLITLHQRKLETLKKLKKAMLQKMFI